jgi:hypothetical protein
MLSSTVAVTLICLKTLIAVATLIYIDRKFYGGKK